MRLNQMEIIKFSRNSDLKVLPLKLFFDLCKLNIFSSDFPLEVFMNKFVDNTRFEKD